MVLTTKNATGTKKTIVRGVVTGAVLKDGLAATCLQILLCALGVLGG
jgi:hypothetical protein